MAARKHLRRKFLSARVAVSGANFGVAETGTLAVVESEGNGRMCLTLPKTLITVMGIEKLLPTFTDLEVFMQLLPRSSTAERMNPYTSMWTGVHHGDGPRRSFIWCCWTTAARAVLADEVGRAALHCIRCSACLNVCPVYERTGGHAYGSVYPGPIGAILSPQLTGTHGHDDPNASLPYASIAVRRVFRRLPGAHRYPVDPGASACGTGRFGTRRPAQRTGPRDEGRRLGDGIGEAVLVGGEGTRPSDAWWRTRTTSRRCPGPGPKWTAARDIPEPPKETFRQWWARTHDGGVDDCDDTQGRGPRADPGGVGHGAPRTGDGPARLRSRTPHWAWRCRAFRRGGRRIPRAGDAD